MMPHHSELPAVLGPMLLAPRRPQPVDPLYSREPFDDAREAPREAREAPLPSMTSLLQSLRGGSVVSPAAHVPRHEPTPTPTRPPLPPPMPAQRCSNPFHAPVPRPELLAPPVLARGLDKPQQPQVVLLQPGLPDPSDRVFVCEWEGCAREFSLRNNLKTHMRVHTGERPYPCLYKDCGKAFTTSGNLKAHIRTHTGEKPYVCPFGDCGKAFADAGSLTKHKRIHTGERPFVCNRCDKSFTQAGHLSRHSRVHERQDRGPQSPPYHFSFST